MRCYWFWHLLYDNAVFGRALHRAVRRWKLHRELSWDWGIEYGIYGLNYRWQRRQRTLIYRLPDGGLALRSPRSWLEKLPDVAAV